VALDQPLGQQIYVCNPTPSGNGWFQMGTLGGSGGLKMDQGTLDINLAVVPRLTEPPRFCTVAAYTVRDASNFYKPFPYGALIFKNGIKQHVPDDYTLVNSGATFSLTTSKLSIGDFIEVTTICQP
jgi:hypothetical protein